MKAFRILAGTLASLALLVPARADVRTITHSQIIRMPSGQPFTEFARNVAIDGASIIVLATHPGGQSALLYQRASGSSEFTYRKTLITFHYPRERMQVRMKNGIAVVHFGDRAWIFERIGTTYVLGRTAAPVRHPGGVAISGSRILIGGDNCEYDAVVYEKGADGIWAITGRMDDNQGQCHLEGHAVELHGDHALVHVPQEYWVNAWRRNGTALEWALDGGLGVNVSVPEVPRIALQNSTAVGPGSGVNLREEGTWPRTGYVLPADFGAAGLAIDVTWRDGVLLTTQAWRLTGHAKPYAFIENAPGFFEHVAILETEYNTIDHDISGRTVVAAVHGPASQQHVAVFVLPEPLAAPAPIPNDFEDRDTSDFTVASGQFALASRGTDDVLAQTGTTGLSLALVDDSDWNYYQRVEADIAPTFGAADSWVGLVARYVDANNYYYVAVRNNNTFGIYRRLNGVDTLLREGTSAGALPSRVQLSVDDEEIRVQINQQFSAVTTDRSLPRGRAGLATFRAAADFDDVHVAATGPRPLLRNQYFPDGDSSPTDAAPLNTLGGNWQLSRESWGGLNGFRQLDPNRSAFAFTGGEVRNQEIDVAFGINAVSSETAAWVGVLGRYVNAGTHYHAILRTTNRVEIRKQVNGVPTVLAAANVPVPRDRFVGVRFRIVEDQLQLYVDGRLVLSARDDDIAEGQYGLATYRAGATWDHFFVTQP
jgi:hypothetical protein